MLQRFQILDMARGMAVVLMTGFHFCYNLQYFQVIHINITGDLFWISLRNLIVGTFIFIAGISLYLSYCKQHSFANYLKKQKLLAVCALLISVATYPIFPDSWIYFGVLHFILAARILGYGLCAAPWMINLVLSGVAIWSGLVLKSQIFEPKWINWIGFSPSKPLTEDYVPLFPWIGVFILGILAGYLYKCINKRRKYSTLAYSGPVCKLLSTTGRNSLAIYMLHQPVLMGAMYLFVVIW